MGRFDNSKFVYFPRYRRNNLVTGTAIPDTSTPPTMSYKSNKLGGLSDGLNVDWITAQDAPSMWVAHGMQSGEFARIVFNGSVPYVADPDDSSIYLLDASGLPFKVLVGIECHINGSKVTTNAQEWWDDQHAQIKVFIYDGSTKNYITNYGYKDDLSICLQLDDDGVLQCAVNGVYDSGDEVTLTVVGEVKPNIDVVCPLICNTDTNCTLDYFEFQLSETSFSDTLSDFALSVYSDWIPNEVPFLTLPTTRAKTDFNTHKGAGLIYVGEKLSANVQLDTLINNTTGVITDAKCFGNISEDDISIGIEQDSEIIKNGMEEHEDESYEDTVSISGFQLIENKTKVVEDAVSYLLRSTDNFTYYITLYKDTDTSKIPSKIYIIPSASMSGTQTSQLGSKVLLNIEGITIEGTKHPDYEQVKYVFTYNETTGEYE
jgi:hypothetical protein